MTTDTAYITKNAVETYNALVSKYGDPTARGETYHKMNRRWMLPKDEAEFLEGPWYDWFCSDEDLLRRGNRLFKKLIEISDSKKFDNSKTYVFFKNNCRINGGLYDDFRICDLETGNVIYTISSTEVWGRENDFSEPIISGSWAKIRRFFNS